MNFTETEKYVKDNFTKKSTLVWIIIYVELIV